jgi:hypothetical protein
MIHDGHWCQAINDIYKISFCSLQNICFSKLLCDYNLFDGNQIVFYNIEIFYMQY